MPVYQVILLAIVQGLTEFLPISSTAHLYLTSWLLGWKAESLTFDIALHIGTLLAVLCYFFRDWVQIVAQGFGLRYGSDEELERNRALLWLLAIGSIPVGVAGLLFNKQAESTWRNPVVMGSMLLIVGLLMALAERAGRKVRDMAGVNLVDASVIGLSQALAVVPGTSRSGITITTGLFRHINREAAARFSFLLSTPAIAAAAAKALHDLLKHGGFEPGMEAAFVLGIAVSTVTGFIVIAWFLRFLRRRGLWFFVFYRIVFGIIVLALAFFRRPAG
jgi:undecaprenyl-diphosphatase